jgi:hypothetical protein
LSIVNCQWKLRPSDDFLTPPATSSLLDPIRRKKGQARGPVTGKMQYGHFAAQKSLHPGGFIPLRQKEIFVKRV